MGRARSALSALATVPKWIGPGFLVAVAYIDPGNYSTDIAAGASTRFQLLFVVALSNAFAVVLQSLSIRLGTVTGKDLAQNCRERLPRWLNLVLYALAETAVVATDVAEVIGGGIAINLLGPSIPLAACCAITFADVLLILVFYNPDRGMRGLRYFEYFVVALVLAVVICFCILLARIDNTTVGEVFHGYLPSSAVVSSSGIYLSCGIIGATVMPHSLYLGSGIVQPRIKEYDENHPELRVEQAPTEPDAGGGDKPAFRPSLSAIKHCLRYSTIELVVSLCFFALFVNSAILIVAGAFLSQDAEEAGNADLFGIFELIASTISRGAALTFAVALLFSGTSAGVVCTIAGQIVSEGHLNWRIAPWQRRLITRLMSLVPSIIISAAVGRHGLSSALNASQAILSALLPFISAPLVWFTSLNRYMTVEVEGVPSGTDGTGPTQRTRLGMRSHLLMSVLAVLIWLVIAVMNCVMIVFLFEGKT